MFPGITGKMSLFIRVPVSSTRTHTVSRHARNMRLLLKEENRRKRRRSVHLDRDTVRDSSESQSRFTGGKKNSVGHLDRSSTIFKFFVVVPVRDVFLNFS